MRNMLIAEDIHRLNIYSLKGKTVRRKLCHVKINKFIPSMCYY